MSGSFSYLKHSFFCPQYTRKSGENASAFLGIWLEIEHAWKTRELLSKAHESRGREKHSPRRSGPGGDGLSQSRRGAVPQSGNVSPFPGASKSASCLWVRNPL